MKNLKIKPGTFELSEFSKAVQKYFNLKYHVTDNNRNEITVAQDKTIGCKIILTKKRMIINGTFATPGRMILAFCILIAGAVIIPMMIYMIAFKGKFAAIEKEVCKYIEAEFPERLGS